MVKVEILLSDTRGALTLEIGLSAPSELRSLREWLERAPGVHVEQDSLPPREGEQGVADVLTVLAGGSGVLAVAIRTLPEFMRSRRIAKFTITLKSPSGKECTLEAENLDEVPSLIAKFLDD